MNFKKRVKEAALVLGMSAMLAGCKTNNAPKETKAVVTEAPDEKEDAINSLRKLGMILEQEECYKDYYKILKSSIDADFENTNSSINDYFEDKIAIPYYDAKCSPKELCELINNAATGYDEYTYGAMSCGSALAYNDKIDNDTGKKYWGTLLDIVYGYKENNAGNGILIYNLLNLEIKEVYDDNEYYSKFDPMTLCIYINKKYVDTKEKVRSALTYAIECASFDAYIDIDGKTVYCSLTNFYYDSKNDKLLEVGNTYRDFIIYYKLYLNNVKIDIPSSQVETLYNFCTAMDLLKTGSGTGTPIVDFSTYLKSVVPALQDQFPSESKEYDIAKILIDSDLGKKEAVHKAIDYCKTINYGIDTITQTIEDSTPWITNLDSLKDNLIEYSNNLGKVR